MDARHRISSYAVWDVAVFVLNVLAFVMIGLQLRGIEVRTPESGWHSYLVCALAVCLTVVLVRLVWIAFYGTIARWVLKRTAPKDQHSRRGRGAALSSWDGAGCAAS